MLEGISIISLDIYIQWHEQHLLNYYLGLCLYKNYSQ
jgi:hypothetical protein